MATIFETITELSGIVTDAITAGNDNNVPQRLIRNKLIKVSTGKYYEVLPIIVPAECCVIGDELRSTNVQPRKATNSSLTPADDFKYTYHSLSRLEDIIDDVVSGATVTATNGNTETQIQSWPYAETEGPKTAVKKLARSIRRSVDIGLGYKYDSDLAPAYDMPVTSGGPDTEYGYARDNLLLNKKFFQEEVIAYITENYPNLNYSRTKCKQDTGFIIDSLAYDLTYGGNWQSVNAGEAYYEGATLNISASEKTATLAAYGYLKSLLQSASRNTTITPVLNSTETQRDGAQIGSLTAQATIGSLMDNITNIITNGSGSVTITYPGTSGVDAQLIASNTAIQTLKPTVQENTIDFINGHFGSFQYNSAKCRRDLNNIITDTAYDVALGTNYNAVFNGRAYNRPNNAYNINTQRTETIGSIRNARDEIKESVGDDGSSAGGSSNATDRVTTAYNEIVDMINNGLSAENALTFPSPVGVDQNRVDAKDNLVANRTFIQEDVVAYVNNTYGSLVYNEGKCRRDVGYIVDALCYDILYGGTQATTRIAESYFVDGDTQVYGQETETVAAYNHAKSIIGDIVREATVTAQSGHTELQTKPGTPATATEETELDSKIDIVTAAITAGNLNSLPAPVYPSITWADAEYQTAHSNIFSDKNDIIRSTIQYINTTYSNFNYNQSKCSRDIGYLMDAARYDMMLNTTYASMLAGISYLRAPASKIVGEQKTATIAANEYVRTQIVDTISSDATGIARINENWDWIQDAIFSGSAEGGNNQTEDPEAYNSIRQLELNKEFIVDELLAYVDDLFKAPATLTAGTPGIFTIADTSWMFVGMPIKFTIDDSSGSLDSTGFDTTSVYYVREIQSATTFTVSDTQYGSASPGNDFAEGFSVVKNYEYNRDLCARDVREYIDAIKWDLTWPQQQFRTYNKYGFDVSLYLPAFYRSKLAARYYVNSVIGSQEEDFYYLRNGTGLRLQTLEGLQGDLGPANEFGTQRPTAGAYASLDPGWGPDDQRVWITARSPYVQNCTTFGFAAVGQKIDGALHNGGNDSIVSNDFTQVISDGIGAWLLNNGRAELVSVFTYYSHIGYLVESGGRMRATNGNNSYGKFGSVAEGVDADETPVTAIVDNEKQYNAVISNVFTDQSDEILQIEYSHAGNDYTEANLNFFGVGTSEDAVSDEFRDQAVHQVRITEIDDSTGNPDAVAGGQGYLIVSNTAQTGTSNSLTIAATDGNSSSAYPGMKILITAGAGAGLFGIVDTYNAGSKLATVVKETDGTAGWDHVIPGTPFVSPNSSSTYQIEPRIAFTAPTRSDTTHTITSDVWNAVQYFETSAQYNNVSTTSTGDGLDATFDVVRNGSKYYVTLNSGGSGYTRLDTISILGTSLGGATPANDITITATTVNSSTGAIEEFDFDGIGLKGKFIALPDSGTTAKYSNDGATWTTTTLNNSYTWTNLANGLIDDGSTTYKASAMVAIGITGGGTAVNYSTDGLSWSAPASQPTMVASTNADIAFGQITATTARFVAIGDGDTDVQYSDDGGVSWTQATGALPATGFNTIAYGQGKFVALKTGSQDVAYSADGITWTDGAGELPASSAWTDIVYGKGRFVAIASDTRNGAYSLDGGATWIQTALTTGGSNTALPVKIAYGQGVFVVTTDDTNELTYSEDGVYWPAPYAISATTYATGLSAIAFGNPDRSPKFVAIQEGTTTALGNFVIGCTAKGRAGIASERLFEIRLTEPGSGYGVTSPTMTVTDPNNIYDALFTVRLDSGALAQPTFINRGSGYISATAEIDTDNSNGRANFLQSGQFVAVRQLSAVPVNGSNIVFDSLPNTVFKLVNVVSRVGTKDGSYTAFLQLSPQMEIEDVVPDGDGVTMRIRFSQVRLTGHDFLDIGTGNFDDTNYPNSVYGDPVNEPDQDNETSSNGGGRVFFTSTDQDGNFRVGNLFSIEQATGVATLNADAFNIAGLQELTLGEVTLGGNSASVTEFSTDPFFTANSDTVVPTQRAIKSYIEAQIGGGGASLIVNSVTAGDIFINTTQISTVSGATINIKANVNFTKSVLGLPLAYNYFLR